MDFGVLGLGVAAAVALPSRLRGATRWIVRFVLVVGVLLALWRASSARFACVGPTVLRVDTDAPMVALTFDDGPSPVYTNAVLAALAAEGVRATFFVTGAELAAHPELGRAVLAAGHELGNHGYTHQRMVFRTQRWLENEVQATDDVLRQVGARGPIPFRPPYGKRLWSLHRVLGDRPAVLWDVEPESYAPVAADPDALVAHVLERARPGSIVLLHAMYSSREPTRAALPELILGLRRRGLEPVPLSTLLAAATP